MVLEQFFIGVLGDSFWMALLYHKPVKSCFFAEKAVYAAYVLERV